MPEGRIRALVMDAYCQVAGEEGYRHQITLETEVEKIHIPDIMRKMSERMGFEIPPRKVPRYGWRISTIVGHITGYQKVLRDKDKNSQITPS